ncbi:flippase [Candidatus Micrarchaeota archaeon]|nr:flippase [Candidatus Micrarchaeota archaeon]
MEWEEEIPQYSKEVAKGSFWNIVGNVIMKLVSFLYVILIARAASQGDVGLFYLALSVVSLVSIFSDLGLAGALMRYIPYFEGRNEKGKIKDLLKLSYAVSSVVAVILMAILWWQADTIAAAYHNPLLSEAIRLLVSYLLLANFLRLGTSALQGFADMHSMQYVSNVQNCLKLVFTVALFYLYGASVLTLSAAFIISHIPAVILAVVSVGRRTASFPSGGTSIPSQQLFGEIVPFGLMLNVVTLFWTMTGYVDRLLLGYFTDPSISTEIVAVYTIAVTMATVLMMFPGAVASIFLPVMSRLAGKNEPAHMRAILETSQRWTMLLTLPLGLVMIVFSQDMLGAFYGQAYASGGLAMAIFTLGLLIQTLAYVLLFALAALRLVKLELRIAFIVTLVNVALNILLIPIYGMEGSAAASLVSCIVMTMMLMHYGSKLFSFRFPLEIYKLVLAAAITFAIMLLMKPYASSFVPLLPSLDAGSLQPYANKIIYLAYLGILGALSTAVFLVLSVILRCLRNEDVLLMKKAMLRAKIPSQLIDLAAAIGSFGVGTRK